MSALYTVILNVVKNLLNDNTLSILSLVRSFVFPIKKNERTNKRDERAPRDEREVSDNAH